MNRLILILLVSISTLNRVAAADKYALLIAVTKYEHARLNSTPLKYPEDDANAMAELLQQGGYTVKVLAGRQATKDAIETGLKEFSRQGHADGVVLIGLFGHGVQYGETGYYCPYDATIREVKDSQNQSLRDKNGQIMTEPDPESLITMRQILDALTLSKAGNRVMLADCCREDPSAARGRNAFGSNLTTKDLPDGTAALFACSRNEQAFEHDDWKHGAFTRAILDQIRAVATRGHVKAGTLAELVHEDVLQMVNEKSRTKQTVTYINSGIVDLQIRLSLPSEITNSIGMKLKLIPAGEFLMGSSDADVAAALKADPVLREEHLKNERPQHRVKISRPFYAGVYEVTQGGYEAVMGTNPSYFSASGGGSEKSAGQNTSRFPVEKVSWYDAVEFCNALSVREGLAAYYTLSSVEREYGHIKSATVTSASGVRQSPATSGYRLPTEAEWEYMCRAGTRSAYWFGNVLNGDKANVDGNYPFGTTTKGTYLERPTTIGSYAANRFGLYDTHGNVWEWCEDVYDESAYGSRSSTTADPLSLSGSEYRLLRGGSWGNVSRYSRSAYRNWNQPDLRNLSYGFRVVR